MAKTPLVFVPGLGGSFNLLVLLDWSAPTLSGWDFPPFISYGRSFVETCARAGYTRDRDLFVAFYDWRKSVPDSAADYLIPWIDRAKARSGSDKVVLVGHSMGGLVARAYIQGSTYRSDIERLITLGTPHQGAPDTYYPWQGGEIRWGPAIDAVFNVYLWYLEHAHPFQTKLNRLRTIRTQAPGVRDLLPVFNYLRKQGAALTPAAQLQQRNLLGELLLSPAGVGQLLARVPLTTINGSGFTTTQALVVGAPPAATDDPPAYVDGKPVEAQTTADGDGTVLLSSANVADARVRNLPAQQIVHDELPDKAVAQVLAELGVAAPAPAPANAPTSWLAILSASPLELSVDLPVAPAPGGVLAEAAPPRAARHRRIRAKNYGHRGKRLNMLLIPDPQPSSYSVRLRGTATGTFALGALLIGPQGATVLSDTAGERPAAQASPISTAHGQVAAATELFYRVAYPAPGAPPQVEFDAAATSQNLLARLGRAPRAAQPRVLSEAAPTPAVSRVLADTATSDDLRALAEAALGRGEAGARRELAARLQAADGATIELLLGLAEALVGPHDQQLALGLLEQVRQVARG